MDLDGGALRAAVVLGADGANGVCAKALGLGDDRAFEVAYEGNLPVTGAAAAEHRGRVTLELGMVPGGYGWIFPKGDHVNVGVGGWAAEGPRLREHLHRLCEAHGDRLRRPRRHCAATGCRCAARGRSRPAARAAVVGDAAGLVDPLSGDGIFEAILSAKLASEAALDVLAGREASMEPYGRASGAPSPTHAATAWAAKVALERVPALTFQPCGRPPWAGSSPRASAGPTPLTVPGSAVPRALRAPGPRAPPRARRALRRGRCARPRRGAAGRGS